MDLRSLEYLVTVVDTGGFTAAGKSLHVSQSGVSAQIRRLERELGSQLLDRSDRKVVPTVAGAALLPHARAALAAADSGRKAVADVSELLVGSLAIGATPAHSYDLPEVVATFHTRFPGLSIQLRESNTSALIDAVRNRSIDIALIGLATTTPPDLDVLVVSDRPLFLLTTPDTPWAARRMVSLPDLSGTPLIAMPTGCGQRDRIDHAFALAGLTGPEVTIEASDPAAIVRLVALGVGSAIVTDTVAADAPSTLTVVPIGRPPLRAQLGLATDSRRPPSPAVRAFLEHARAQLTAVVAR